jgi:thiamine kinase-like enzyme
MPLRGLDITERHLTALAEAVKELHSAIPADKVQELPASAWYPLVALDRAKVWSSGELDLGSDPAVAAAVKLGTDWLAGFELESGVQFEPAAVFGHSDGNMANFLWDGSRVRVVDFELSGRSDRAFELAEMVEHISMWVEGEVDADFFLSCFELADFDYVRLRNFRMLFAFTWLLMLLPGRSASVRNPPGTLEIQARRFLRFFK